MKKLRSRIAVSITTAEALEHCLADQVSLFCIEEPLYSLIRQEHLQNRGFSEYELDDHPDSKFMLAMKTQGKHPFLKTEFKVYYWGLSDKDT